MKFIKQLSFASDNDKYNIEFHDKGLFNNTV